LARLTGWLPKPIGEDPSELAYAEATARRLAARRTVEALGMFEHLPNVHPEVVEEARQTFTRWEREATASLDELDGDEARDLDDLHRRQAEALSRVAATEALDELEQVGLLPAVVARRAAEVVATGVGEA
jgi:hypothetical protein